MDKDIFYKHKDTEKVYKYDIPFRYVTKDWNNDGDVYPMEVCYLKNESESWREETTREELIEFYELISL